MNNKYLVRTLFMNMASLQYSHLVCCLIRREDVFQPPIVLHHDIHLEPQFLVLRDELVHFQPELFVHILEPLVLLEHHPLSLDPHVPRSLRRLIVLQAPRPIPLVLEVGSTTIIDLC